MSFKFLPSSTSRLQQHKWNSMVGARGLTGARLHDYAPATRFELDLSSTTTYTARHKQQDDQQAPTRGCAARWQAAEARDNGGQQRTRRRVANEESTREIVGRDDRAFFGEGGELGGQEFGGERAEGFANRLDGGHGPAGEGPIRGCQVDSDLRVRCGRSAS